MNILEIPEEYQITEPVKGVKVGVGRNLEIIVRPAQRSVSNMFKRRSVKKGAVNGETCWLVAELDGVRLYISEGREKLKMLMTYEDINP